jgi:hypothetical protein
LLIGIWQPLQLVSLKGVKNLLFFCVKFIHEQFPDSVNPPNLSFNSIQNLNKANESIR